MYKKNQSVNLFFLHLSLISIRKDIFFLIFVI